MKPKERIPYDKNVCPKRKECDYVGCTLGEVVDEKKIYECCALYHRLIRNLKKDENNMQ